MTNKIKIISSFKLTDDQKKALIKKHFQTTSDVVFFGNYAAVLKSDGTVELIGQNEELRRIFSEWSFIVKISAGKYHVSALDTNGRVFSAGDNSYGQCNVSSWNDIKDLFAGDFCTIGITEDGEVKTAGTVTAIKNNPSEQDIQRKYDALKNEIYDLIGRRIREQNKELRKYIDDSLKNLVNKPSESLYPNNKANNSGEKDIFEDLNISEERKKKLRELSKSLDDLNLDDIPLAEPTPISEQNNQPTSNQDIINAKKIRLRFDGYYEKKSFLGKNENVRFYEDRTSTRYFGNEKPDIIMDRLEKNSTYAEKGKWYNYWHLESYDTDNFKLSYQNGGEMKCVLEDKLKIDGAVFSFHSIDMQKREAAKKDKELSDFFDELLKDIPEG